MRALKQWGWAVGLAVCLGGCASEPKPTLRAIDIYAAGPGSAFLPYAQGLAAFLSAQGLTARAVESRGSIENLQQVDASSQNLGTAFLGTAYEAVTGTAAWTQGRRLENIRALTPMYET